MGTVKQEVHRPGVFKQVNKAHKTGRHHSKGSISSDAKGKVGVKVLSKRASKNLSKEARRHQSSQIRKNKREEVLQRKRNLGGSYSAPILVCVIPLQEDVDVENVLSILTIADGTTNITNSPCGTTHFSISRFKQHFSILVPPGGNLFATLDVAKVATTIIFVACAVHQADNNPREVLDDWGKEIMLPCVAEGLTIPVVALVNLEKLHIKKHQDF
ncbi:Pre-rRNA-processing protein TSR1 homolog [Anthophora plagiata]